MRRFLVVISRNSPRLLVGLIVAMLLIVSIVSAQTGGGYDLTWSTMDSGGGAANGGGYELSGTIGQPDAGALSGGGYTLVGGFWPGAALNYTVFLPVVLKN
jgi:hypothetical protein